MDVPYILLIFSASKISIVRHEDVTKPRRAAIFVPVREIHQRITAPRGVRDNLPEGIAQWSLRQRVVQYIFAVNVVRESSDSG